MRQRARKACVPCRKRKRKCDGQRPCSGCDEFEYRCVYEEAPHRAGGLMEGRAPRTENSQLSPVAVSLGASVQRSLQSSVARTRGFLDVPKSQYFNKESSISFPRSLAVELQTSSLPRLHAFAYHAGVRSEPTFSPRNTLTDSVTFPQVERLLDIYEVTVHPVFGIVDLPKLRQQCYIHWNGQSQGAAFEGIVSGVIALSSLFSEFLTRQVEAALVEHAKLLLEAPFCVSPPNVRWVTARILRTIYLRATSRPWTAWLCSSTAMHLAEAVGLHRDPEEVTMVVDSGGRLPETASEMRERTFQVARSLNLLISYDYGRSYVNLGIQRQGTVAMKPGDFTDQFCSLVNIIAADNTSVTSTTEDTDLLLLLDQVCNAEADHDFIILTRAELALCIYRRLHHFGYSLDEEKVNQIIMVGCLALQAAERLAALRQPWWNILGTVFHFICVLLSVNSNSSLEKIPEALQTLEHLSQQLNTAMATEAVQTANDLIHASLSQRRKATQNLENALTRRAAVNTSPADQTLPGNEWDIFLQPFDQAYFTNTDFADSTHQEDYGALPRHSQ